MSDDAVASEALRARFTSISPDKCRSRRQDHAMVPSVVAPLPVGLPEPRLVYMSDFTHSNGWVVLIHPEGSLYLHHPAERTVMEYPDDETAFDKIVVETTMCMTALWLAFERLPPESRPDRDNCELFLRIEQKTRDRDILYYFVDYTRRHVFWAQAHTLDTPIVEYAHLVSILQFQFWIHVERFPAHRRLPLGAREELHGILIYQIVDVTTNVSSTAPYTSSDAAMFIKCVKAMGESSSAIDGASNAAAARLWGDLCRVRSVNLHRAPQVRIGWTRHPSRSNMEAPHRWYQLISLILLFNEPYRCYENLMHVFDHEVLYHRFWNSLFNNTLLKEWSDHALMATVTLTANMAFLAVGNFGNKGAVNDGLSPTSFVLSLCSTTFSIGAIVLGKLLPNFHRRLQRYSSSELADWMTSPNMQHRDSLYKLAMLFSMPFAFFMWSLVLFVAALFSFAFRHWMWATCMPIAIVSAVIVGVLTISLLFLSTGGSLFIQPIDKDPKPSMWARLREQVEAVDVTIHAGVLQLATRDRSHVEKLLGETVVGNQHASDEIAAPSRTRASADSVEDKVEIGLEVP